MGKRVEEECRLIEQFAETGVGALLREFEDVGWVFGHRRTMIRTLTAYGKGPYGEGFNHGPSGLDSLRASCAGHGAAECSDRTGCRHRHLMDDERFGAQYCWRAVA